MADAGAAFGLAVEMPAEPVELWAEHVDALRLFEAMVSQWRTGRNGVIGLDYAALPVVERRLGFTPRRARRAFAFLQVMEAEALRVLAPADSR